MRKIIISPRTPRKLFEFVARGEAATIEHGVGMGWKRHAVDAKAYRDATLGEAFRKGAEGRARIEMSLIGEKQPLAEAPGKIRLERADARLVDAFVMQRARGEAFDFAGIARRGDDKRAVVRNARNAPTPPFARLPAKLDDFGRRAFTLAPWRQHAARAP